ncbi:PfkB family carbohydrate kinase [Streptomyces sp. NBC_01005]|uniref:PfkB family carbohydrate kinase n=1 Tax=unclassified Streptomyces TaxID=2593676 RepID=UPI003863BBE8|nr:PfkB family carbohydrate kinase [Streptomyces sp. NBC_01005]WTC99784.1 PfkB family carbohydrate kinase [Streptomyces sp. NBC_01650]
MLRHNSCILSSKRLDKKCERILGRPGGGRGCGEHRPAPALSRLSLPGRDSVGDLVKEGFGGKEGHEAVAVPMGTATHLVAKGGGDADGLKAVANLRSASVGVDTVITEVSTPTGQALVMVDPHGENRIAVISGANAPLSAQDVTDALTVLRPLAGDVILTSGEIPLPCLQTVAGFLTPGTRWVHNAAPAGILPAWPQDNRPLLVVNEVEARQLTGAADARAAAQILAEAASDAVVTLGGDGAQGAQEGLYEHIPTSAVTLGDTTGSGDVFCGVLAAELAHGSPLTRAAATATAAAVFAVTALGARGAIPRPNDHVRLRAH